MSDLIFRLFAIFCHLLFFPICFATLVEKIQVALCGFMFSCFCSGGTRTPPTYTHTQAPTPKYTQMIAAGLRPLFVSTVPITMAAVAIYVVKLHIKRERVSLNLSHCLSNCCYTRILTPSHSLSY